MSEEERYVTNFTFPNGETFYVKDTKAREDIEELKKHGSGDTANAVLYTEQALTSAQQTQARENIGAGTYVKPSGGIPASDFAAGVIPDISGKANAADVYTKTEVDQKLVGAMNYKGTKATVSALPTSGNKTGDVWHITADGSEWAWNGSAWEELGAAVDLSGYRTASAQDTIDAAKYTKPSGGIPKSDLASDVQASLGKADSALQQHQSLTGYATQTWVEDKGYQTSAQVQAAISNVRQLPAVTASDNGKFLRVVSGAWAAQTVPSAEGSAF